MLFVRMLHVDEGVLVVDTGVNGLREASSSVLSMGKKNPFLIKESRTLFAKSDVGESIDSLYFFSCVGITFGMGSP